MGRKWLWAIAGLIGTGGLAAQPRFDLIVRGGLILDGTGAGRYRGDVAIRDGRIVAVGALGNARAGREIDARGLMVAPGFVNLHSHASPAALPTAENMLTQGVTTELLNADGGGPVDLADQLATIERGGLALNVAASIGFNAVWSSVMGPSARRPTDGDIRRMQQLILAGLDAGAYGVSAGLDYKPAYFATTDEVVRILQPAGLRRTFFPNHDRVTPETGYSGRAGLEETTLIGERTGLVPQFTHMKIQGREQGTAGETIAMMDSISRSGRWIASDVYPYLAGQTALVALIIPGWAQDGGIEALRGRLRDPETRSKIVAEADQAIAARFNGPDRIMVLGTRRLSDIMRETGALSGGAAVATILETESPWAILGFGIEDDLVKLMQYHSAAIACDCGATTGSRGHPRYFGTYPRVLGRYVREQRIMSWEDAIRKMTGLPAAMMGLADRGLLAPGMAADLVVFDSARVIDHATFERPDAMSEGVRHVVVNGAVALEAGRPTGATAGVVLRRRHATPSRPMDLGVARRLDWRGELAQDDGSVARVSVAIGQPKGARRATGNLLVRWSGGELRAETLGTLQATGGWASVTGTGRLAGLAGSRWFALTLDDGAQAGPERAMRLHLTVEGLNEVEASGNRSRGGRPR